MPAKEKPIFLHSGPKGVKPGKLVSVPAGCVGALLYQGANATRHEILPAGQRSAVPRPSGGGSAYVYLALLRLNEQRFSIPVTLKRSYPPDDTQEASLSGEAILVCSLPRDPSRLRSVLERRGASLSELKSFDAELRKVTRQILENELSRVFLCLLEKASERDKAAEVLRRRMQQALLKEFPIQLEKLYLQVKLEAPKLTQPDAPEVLYQGPLDLARLSLEINQKGLYQQVDFNVREGQLALFLELPEPKAYSAGKHPTDQPPFDDPRGWVSVVDTRAVHSLDVPVNFQCQIALCNPVQLETIQVQAMINLKYRLDGSLKQLATLPLDFAREIERALTELTPKRFQEIAGRIQEAEFLGPRKDELAASLLTDLSNELKYHFIGSGTAIISVIELESIQLSDFTFQEGFSPPAFSLPKNALIRQARLGCCFRNGRFWLPEDWIAYIQNDPAPISASGGTMNQIANRYGLLPNDLETTVTYVRGQPIYWQEARIKIRVPTSEATTCCDVEVSAEIVYKPHIVGPGNLRDIPETIEDAQRLIADHVEALVTEDPNLLAKEETLNKAILGSRDDLMQCGVELVSSDIHYIAFADWFYNQLKHKAALEQARPMAVHSSTFRAAVLDSIISAFQNNQPVEAIFAAKLHELDEAG